MGSLVVVWSFYRGGFSSSIGVFREQLDKFTMQVYIIIVNFNSIFCECRKSKLQTQHVEEQQDYGGRVFSLQICLWTELV